MLNRLYTPVMILCFIVLFHVQFVTAVRPKTVICNLTWKQLTKSQYLFYSFVGIFQQANLPHDIPFGNL